MPSFDEALRRALEASREQICEDLSESGAAYRYAVIKEGTMRHFEYTKSGGGKFWNVFPPHKINSNMWGVRVEFGKLHSSGQVRVHAERTENLAWRYYNTKLEEKQRKGYVQKHDSTYANPRPTYASPRPTKRKTKGAQAECGHKTLTISGKNTWKCSECRTVIEFGAGFDRINESPGDETEAGRYINLEGL
jgi:predicted DNA-binding WGR domain protein